MDKAKVSSAVVSKVVPRTRYGYDVDKASLDSGLTCLDPSRTVQSMAEEADINTIVKRFGITGELPLNSRIPLQLDIDDILDYRTCLDRVRNAEAAFASLPAAVRSRFENNPADFVEYAVNPDNLTQLREWGLAPPAPAQPAAESGAGAPTPAPGAAS